MKKSEETDYGEYSKGAEPENECTRKVVVDEIVGELLEHYAKVNREEAEAQARTKRALKERRRDP